MASLGSVSFTSAQDPELQAIERRRRLAEMLAQQAGEPTQVQPNAPISPLSGLAKALRGYTAGSGMRKADEAEKDYSLSYQKELANVLGGDLTSTYKHPQAQMLAAQIRMQKEQQAAELAAKEAEANRVPSPERQAYEMQLKTAGRAPQLSFDERMQLAQAGRAPVSEEFGVTPQIVQKADGWYERVYSKSGQVTERKLEGEPVRGMQYNPDLQGNIAQAKKEGTETGVVASELADRSAAMPNLMKVADELSALGKTATYTKAGQVRDSLKRQLGMDVGEGAVARTEYISKVDNEVLPLLRSTFGAQFTQKEGESLKVTLGDPDKSPEEKDAVLRSFIQSKQAQMKTLERRTRTAAPADDGWAVEEVK